MNRVYRLVWNSSLETFVAAAELARAKKKTRGRRSAVLCLAALAVASTAANADTFLEFGSGLGSWTTGGAVTLHNTTVTVPTGGATFTLTPAAGYDMARINAPNGGNLLSPNATFGLSSNSLESFLNNSNGNITNWGLLTKEFTFSVGTYTFAWAYGAEDYQPYNDGAVFTLAGGGSQSIVSLARNGSSPSDTSGPSPGTQILGSYGATPWITTSFDITTAGNYQVGFGVYNWGDQSLAPNLYVSGIAGTYTGTPVQTATPPPPPPPPVIGGTGGNVSGSVFDPSSAAYSATELTFAGGTLQYNSDMTTSKDAVLTDAGGAIDTNGHNVDYTGAFSGSADFYKEGAGNLNLSAANTYTGQTNINGGTLVLTGAGSIAASSEVVNNSALDLSGTTNGASVQTMSGNGSVELGTKSLTVSNASTTFAGDINGAGSVDLAAGNLALAGANTYTGATNINGGTLALTGAGSIADSSSVNVAGTLDIAGTTAGASVKTIAGSGAVQLGNKALTVTEGAGEFGGTIGGAGSLQVAGGDIALSGANTYTGATQINGGTLALTGNGSIESSSGVVNNGVLDVSNSTGAPKLQTISGNGVVNLGTKNLTLTSASGSYNGGFSGAGSVNIDSGTITLAGASTQTGGLNLSNGAKVVVANDAALGDAAGTVSLNNATLSNVSTLSLAQKINVAGVSTFETAANGSMTAAGGLAGGGTLVKQGAGTLVLSSDNSAFGVDDPNAAIVVNEGILALTNANGLGNANVVLNAGSLSAEAGGVLQNSLVIAPTTSISTTAGTTFTVSGPITSTGSGNGCFEKVGTGTLVMAGTADIAPGTCVQDGKLYANGVLNSVVTVQSDGVLRGTGVITGPTTVNGRLAPGNSPGTLQSTATVTMTTGSVYQEDINGTGTGAGPGNYSRLVLTGADSQFVASGATLEPNLTGITGTDTYTPYVPKLGDAFRIITAEGGIVGQFDSVAQPDGLAANTKMEVFYDVGGSRSVDLFVIPTSYRAYVGGVGGNKNAQSSGAAVDTLFGAKAAGTVTERQEALLYAVSAHTEASLESFSTLLAGELHGAMAAAAPLAGRWLVDSVGRQLSQGMQPEGGQGLWVDVGGNRSDWDSDSFASAFDTTRSQVAIGLDVLSTRNARVGVGFTHGKVDVQSSVASGSTTHDIGFVYGQMRAGAVVVDGTGAIGKSDWESDRRDPVAPLASLATDFGGKDALVSLGVRLPVDVKSLTLSPYVRGTWERTSRDAFNEGNESLASLTSTDYRMSGTRVTAGLLGGSNAGSLATNRFAYQFNVGVGREASGIARASFDAALAGVETMISSPEVGRTFVFGQVNATARITPRLYGYIGASAESRSGKNEDLGANLGVRMTF